MTPVVSGIISNVLLRLGDDTAETYPSGKVNQMIFASLPQLNASLMSSYSGVVTVGEITPEISGTNDQAVLELIAAKELTRRTMSFEARSYSMTAFSEGDSKVTIGDAVKSLSELYKWLSEDLERAIQLAKYTSVSLNPSAVRGVDAQIPEYYPPSNYPYNVGGG